MKEFILDNPENIHSIINKYRKSTKYKFRGQSNIDWKLVPKAGRLPYKKVDDEKIFSQWKRRAKSLISNEDFNDWDLLAIAQHTGLPTRFLDWTMNPLVATFFACCENSSTDGVVWVINPDYYITEKFCKYPFDTPLKTILLHQPSSPSPRLVNQYGYFTVHNTPDLELNEMIMQLSSLEKIIIPKELKAEIIFLLNQYGVNYLSIYPDLEGLSKHISWFYQNFNYWDTSFDEKL